MINHEFEIRYKTGTRIEQIEMACLSLLNLFASLYTNAISMADDEERFQEITIDLSKIGTAFVDSVRENLSHFIEPDDEKELEQPDFGRLAKMLSSVLRNPKLPVQLNNEIMQAINNIHNSAETSMIDELETSPEYLKSIFEAYYKNHSEK